MRPLNAGAALTFALLLTPLLLTPDAARPQAPPKLEFEVATVRALAPPAPGEKPGLGRRSGGPGTPDPGRLSYSNQLLSMILADAFDVYWNQITGPDWLPVDHYDIVAKVPAETTKEQAKQMLQNLLVDRLHMTFHMQTKVVDGYEITVAPGGPKLTAHLDSAPAAQTRAPQKDPFPTLEPGERVARRMSSGNVYMRFADTSVQELAKHLGANLSSASMVKEGPMLISVPPPILDRTGLTGTYDFTFDYAGGVFFAAAALPTMVGSIESSLTKQIGLKMVEAKVPVKVLVIDHIDRTPEEN
jgi:uncharacterized protein (TIGR03435 family)